jgi:hypothetical protein
LRSAPTRTVDRTTPVHRFDADTGSANADARSNADSRRANSNSGCNANTRSANTNTGCNADARRTDAGGGRRRRALHTTLRNADCLAIHDRTGR